MKRIKSVYPSRISSTVALALTSVISASVCADVEISGTLNSSLVHQTIDTSSDSDNYVDKDTLQVSPVLAATYTSRKASLYGTATHLYQYFDLDQGSTDTNYTQYTYGGTLSVIDNLLQVYVNGSQQYQTLQASSYISSDFLLNSDNLSKVSSHSGGALLSVQPGEFWGANGSATFFKVTSDRSLDTGTSGVDSTGANYAFSVYNGDWFRNAYWNLSGAVQRSERQSYGLFESLSASAEWGYNLIGDWGFVLTGSHQENEVDGEINTGQTVFNSQFNKFTTYGAGFNFRPASGRFLTITANKIASDGVDDGKTFLGVNLQWQFSSRTSIEGSYGRRYYGDAGSFSFRHGTRAVRTVISYQESTTTYSNLLFSLEDAGTFVCGATAVDISDCYQPDSLDYELEAGEQFVEFSEVVSELTDQAILRRQLGGSLGFDRRKLNLSIEASYVDTQYSESERQQITKNGAINASLRVGARSSLFARIQQSNTTVQLTGSESITDNTIYTLGLRNQLSRNLTVNGEVRYLDTETQGVDTTTTIESLFSLNETRITLGLTYNFL